MTRSPATRLSLQPPSLSDGPQPTSTVQIVASPTSRRIGAYVRTITAPRGVRKSRTCGSWNGIGRIWQSRHLAELNLTGAIDPDLQLLLAALLVRVVGDRARHDDELALPIRQPRLPEHVAVE